MSTQFKFFDAGDAIADSSDVETASFDASSFSAARFALDVLAIGGGTVAFQIETRIPGTRNWAALHTTGAISTAGVTHVVLNEKVVEADVFGEMRCVIQGASGSAAGLTVQIHALFK